MDSSDSTLNDEQLEKQFECDLRMAIESAEKSNVLKLASLDKYLYDRGFTKRFVNAASTEQDHISRMPYYAGIKAIDPTEELENKFDFFLTQQEQEAENYRHRLLEAIDDEKKIDAFIQAFIKNWFDGSRRQTSPEMMAIKASIRDHDRFYSKKDLYMYPTGKIEDSVEALFDPDEMAQIFDITWNCANTLIEDYLEHTGELNFSSTNLLYLHRGLHLKEEFQDELWSELNYLSSYSLAITPAELFAQINSHKGDIPAMLGVDYPAFNKRIVMFAPLLKEAPVTQLEFCTAPPIEPFGLIKDGEFDDHGGQTRFLEYTLAPLDWQSKLKISQFKATVLPWPY